MLYIDIVIGRFNFVLNRITKYLILLCIFQHLYVVGDNIPDFQVPQFHLKPPIVDAAATMHHDQEGMKSDITMVDKDTDNETVVSGNESIMY